MTDGLLHFRSSHLYIHWMRFRTLVAVPFVALALVGCSSSDGGSGGGATTPANATVITAIEGIAWDAESYAATAVDGKVAIAVTNQSSLPHDLHLIDAESVDVGLDLKVDNKGDTDSASVALAAGSYQVICTIAGHANMKATLTVS
jgi:plastocyanin